MPSNYAATILIYVFRSLLLAILIKRYDSDFRCRVFFIQKMCAPTHASISPGAGENAAGYDADIIFIIENDDASRPSIWFIG